MTQCYGHISSRGLVSRDQDSLNLIAPLPPPHSTQSKMCQLFATTPSPLPWTNWQ
ncbi:uncharacterized protein BDW43DRAFT_278696 [Aspergillus alliaceus]|uniref:uncharacterized protein n=1 Tax=Petromyces alliaceus TaxID=209559 RepID=UPI0012A67920|nr:uncharacterized protein BDW43DRAFT_278696 [Aspergillus alliaceus]KAB8232821.1 hypothetical protein BDW43DRAFT_278696 [Aspergillus alliaceus]